MGLMVLPRVGRDSLLFGVEVTSKALVQTALLCPHWRVRLTCSFLSEPLAQVAWGEGGRTGWGTSGRGWRTARPREASGR